ncbi:MAG TPA: polysaccharide deacetylase family protein, partial [Rhodothermales bacterium]
MIVFFSSYVPRLVSRFISFAVWRSDATERVIHLTFDDGPSATETVRILDTLDRHGARATFFLLGTNAMQHPELVREIVRRGHGIGGHGHAHLDPWRSRAADVVHDFETGCGILEEITGAHVRLIRPPYGRLRPCLMQWARATGRMPVMWDVMPGDYLPRISPTRIRRAVERMIRPGSIVVLHDNPSVAPVTAEALDQLLPVLRRSGWA